MGSIAGVALQLLEAWMLSLSQRIMWMADSCNATAAMRSVYAQTYPLLYAFLPCR